MNFTEVNKQYFIYVTPWEKSAQCHLGFGLLFNCQMHVNG